MYKYALYLCYLGVADIPVNVGMLDALGIPDDLPMVIRTCSVLVNIYQKKLRIVKIH